MYSAAIRPAGGGTIGRYVTSEMVWLGASGIFAGLTTGLLWRAAGRTCWGAAPFILAVLIAARFSGRSDWPHRPSMVAAGAIVILLAGAGAVGFLAGSSVRWGWMAVAGVISAGGVWAGVPETGPALLAGGGIIGLGTAAVLTEARWAPSAGVGMAAVLGWAALSGAAGRPWAVLGGTLCTGLAPWFALRPFLPTRRRSRTYNPGPWLLGAHAALVILAARWVGVDPDAGWRRVAIVAFAGIVVARSTRWQA